MKNGTLSQKAPLRPRTRMVHAGTARSPFAETCEAIYYTSGYVYGTAEDAEAAFNNTRPRYQYSRFGNPTVQAFETRMAEIEGADAARATASGMAAVFASLMCQLKAGDRVASSDALFGSCQFIVAEILPRFGIDSVQVDGRDLDQWRTALARKTATVFLESPSNPSLRLVDIPAVCELAHASGARVIVDNVFATPLLQKPLELGADIVVYSATKHIDGQGRTLGGVVLGTERWVVDTLQPFLRHTGPALSPMNAWLLLKGLETLDLRLMEQCRATERIARFLAGRLGDDAVLYPGLASHPQRVLVERQMTAGGTVVALEIPGGKAGAFRFMNAMKLILISNNLGDSKSLATHPATTTHQRLAPAARLAQGIPDGLVRISVGLEDVADLEDDLDQALRAV